MRHFALFSLAILLFACGGGGSSSDDDAGAGGNGDTDMGQGGSIDVPYEGDLPALPAGTMLDPMDYFPLVDGAVWRFRKKTDNWQDPPPVEQGGESTVRVGEEGEVTRITQTVIELEIDDELKKVNQTIEETYELTPPDGQLGPQIKFKRLKVTEREVEGNRFVRELDRTYSPAYPLLSDSWRTGQFDTNIKLSTIRLVETRLLRGEEEPTEIKGLIGLNVKTATSAGILPMEGQYREEVRKIEVFDDFTGQITRTYWVQQGVGIVQWQFRDTNNITFTLTETNLESE